MWDKTKAYQNSKIGEKRTWFDVWENSFFFFLFFVSASLLSVRESILKKKKKKKKKSLWKSFFSFIFPVSVP